MMNRASAVAALVFATSLVWSGEARLPSQPAYVIPFEFDENTVWLKVKVNGKGPFTFMLDTAAANFAIDWAEAERAGLTVLEVLQSGPVGSGDGVARTGVVREATVEIGPVRLNLPYIGAVSLAAPQQSWDRTFHGVVGTPLFEKYTVAVDYAAREIRLYDPESFEYSGRGSVWPVRLTHKTPFVKASFVFPGRTAAQGDFLVDSGMRVVALFSSPYSAEHGLEQALRAAGRRLISIPTMGAQGESGRWVGRIDSFSAGPFTLKQPVIGVSTAKGGFFAQPGVAGAIGTEVLRRFTVIFDYERGRLSWNRIRPWRRGNPRTPAASRCGTKANPGM